VATLLLLMNELVDNVCCQIKMDHPTFIVYVNQLPNWDEGQQAGYVLSDCLATVVNRLVVAGFHIFICAKPFKFPPIYESVLMYTGDRVLTKKEYNGEHVYVLQYYQNEYDECELNFIKHHFDKYYQTGHSSICDMDVSDELENRGVFDPVPKIYPLPKT